MATGFLDDNESLMRLVGHTVGDVEVFTTATQSNKSYYCIHFPVESVIANIRVTGCTGEDALETTLPAGTTLFLGKITDITLTSGICIGYTR
jgi:hypothetical protein